MTRWLGWLVCLALGACATASTSTAPAETHPAQRAAPSQNRGRIVVTETEVEILDPIRFLSGSAAIHPSSTRILDAIASTLTGNPSIKLVQIHAYGVDALAQFQARVGAERAQAIVDQLVLRGVQRDRLLAIGAAVPPPGLPAGPSLEIVQRATTP